MTAQAVSPGSVYLSWTFDPGSCGTYADVFQDGAWNARVDPSDLVYVLRPNYPWSHAVKGLEPGSSHCYEVAVSESCTGGFSGQTYAYTFHSKTACVTTLPADVPPDTTPPLVVSTTPADGWSGAWGRVVTVQFSEIVDPGTVTRRSFALSGSGVGSTYLGVEANVAQILVPDPLAANATYTAAVTADVTDLAGNALVPYSWAFTTQP